MYSIEMVYINLDMFDSYFVSKELMTVLYNYIDGSVNKRIQSPGRFKEQERKKDYVIFLCIKTWLIYDNYTPPFFDAGEI